MRFHLKHFLLTCLAMGSHLHMAQASAQSDSLNILLCAPGGDIGSNASFDALVKRSTAQHQDGPYLFKGPLRAEAICIKDATFGAAFGVLSASAEVCSPNYQILLAEVRKRRPQLTENKNRTEPGVLAVFEDSKYVIQFFIGSPALMDPPDPASKTISYICSQKFSGPQ